MFARNNETQFLLNHIQPHHRVLEYGSGESTIEISKLCEKIVSIEHDPMWYTKILKSSPSNVKILLKKPNSTYIEGSHCGTYDQFKDYINAPRRYGKFDIIFIDGRARIECAKFIKNVSNPDTIVFIHDFTTRIDSENYGEVLNYLEIVESVGDMSMFRLKKIKLFNPDGYIIDTRKFTNILHDKIVADFETEFAKYVGAKYACSINSATNAIFLLFLNKNITVDVPSMIPPVVLNALITSGNKINFVDNVDWVGGSYTLHQFDDYKVIDSAQRVDKDQFTLEANPEDVMFFSFYPTKPVGSSDGGMIVSNDFEKIKWLKEAVMNGMSYAENNWDRKIKFPGYKMYMNSFQATIAMNNLKKLDGNKYVLQQIRKKYNDDLFGYEYNKSDHLYRILVDDNKKFISYMNDNDIICGIHYDSQHNNPVYNPNSISYNCPISEENSKRTVSIPFHPSLSDDEVKKVIKIIKGYGKN